MDFKDLRGKKVTVMGLGLNNGGVQTVKWLCLKKAKVTVTDFKSRRELFSSIKQLKKFKIIYHLGGHRIGDFQKADLIIKNPGVDKNSRFLLEAKKRKIPVETDISMFLRFNKSKIIAVTGTKGKSTTATLIYKILKEAGIDAYLAGNIRVSPLTLLEKAGKKSWVVLEMSSWQLEDIRHLKFSPKIAVITNIYHDHLDRYRSFKEYMDSKSLVFRFQRPEGLLISNLDDPNLRKLVKNVNRQKLIGISYGDQNLDDLIFVKKGKIYGRFSGRDKYICPTGSIALLGRHNVYNAMLAIGATCVLKVKATAMKKILIGFRGVPDRLEKVRIWKGIDFYNDTAATAPTAAIAALEAIKGKIVLIAGGTDKNLPYSELSKKIKEKVFFTILLPGSATEKIKKNFKKISYSNWEDSGNMKEAVDKALARARRGTTVILSPGAASFGLFLNEFDRGRKFKQAVKKIK